MSRLRFVLPLLPLFGCPALEASCDTMAVASVMLNVATADDADVDIVATYTANGAAPVDCDLVGDSGEFVCGYEVEGDLEITVSADGYAPETTVVTVGSTEDGCHVRTETVDVTLEPAAE